MNEIPIETDELGITIMKKQIDYLDDCEQKFKKKIKITKSKKRDIVENILIYGFDKFISISEKNNIDDECTVKIYFYIHGLRDIVKTDAILEKEWKNEDDLKKELINLVLTLSQYSDLAILKLKNNIIKKSKKYFPDFKVPFIFSIYIKKVFGNRKLLNSRN